MHAHTPYRKRKKTRRVCHFEEGKVPATCTQAVQPPVLQPLKLEQMSVSSIHRVQPSQPLTPSSPANVVVTSPAPTTVYVNTSNAPVVVFTQPVPHP